MKNCINIHLPEYISSDERNQAYYFVNMLLKSLPIKKGEKTSTIDGVNVFLSYNKTKVKRESDLKIKYNDKLYSAKFLHSDLNHYNELDSNWLTAFILNHKKDIEDFVS